MKLALCAIPFFAIAAASAQQPDQLLPKKPYVVTEAQTITIGELQQRNRTKALGAFGKAKLLARKGDHAGAIKAFEKVLTVDPLFSDARNDLAVELIVLGQEDRAVEQLQQLIQLDPSFLLGYTNLSVILCRQKHYADAEAALRRVLSINPSSAKANLLFALALQGQGKDGAETRNALEAAKSLPLASRLLKEWFGTSDVADARSPH